MSIHQLSTKSIYKDKWMEVTVDQVATESGKEFTYSVVHKQPCVLIVPWDGQHFYLVGQHRYPVNLFSWEFPQGHFEHDTIIDTAKHELEEEAGVIAGAIKEVGVMSLAPGQLTQRCHVFIATELSSGKRALEETEEGMQVQKVTIEKFRQMIVTGEINDGPSIAAFGMLVVKNVIPNLT